MAKRDAQVFEWIALNGVLTVKGRKDSAQEGVIRTYHLADYPDAIRQKIADAGYKSVFQQRTSQVDSDELKLVAWDELDAMFQLGDWEKEGGARGAPVVAAWIEAAAEHKKCSTGEFQASWSKLDKPTRDKIKAACEKRFADRIVEIKETRKEGVDLTDMG